MCFAASEYLLAEGVAGTTVIESFDRFLDRFRRPEDVLDPRHIATTLDVSVNQTERVLDAYVGRGLLRSQQMAECPSCQTLTSAEGLERDEAAGDSHPCPGGCGEDLTDSNTEAVTVYFFVETPDPPAPGG